jgi:hypothetical protein
MNCEVIKDLLPLHIDGCCSRASSGIVEEHLKNCASCKEILEGMKTPCEVVAEPAPPTAMHKVSAWKASVLQSALLFVSFAAIALGVKLEAATPSGLLNGFWAANLVIPATGFLLSLANWYFVTVYRSRKTFSVCSLLATLGITVAAYIWSGFHYEVNVIELFAKVPFREVLEVVQAIIGLNALGLSLSIVFCVLSKILSDRYAKMLGKE